MGFYINNTGKQELPAKGKSAILVEDCGAEILAIPPPSIETISEDKTIICVFDNGEFEAAGLAYDDTELRSFADWMDSRERTWLLMDKELAYKLTGYDMSQISA
jgi:hypothetical protein